MSKYIKIMFLICLFVVLNRNLIHAQEQNSGESKTIKEEIKLNRTGINNMDRVQKIKTYFCSNGYKEADLQLALRENGKPGEIKNICILLYNKNAEEVKINLGFSYGNKDSGGNIHCNTKEGQYNKLAEELAILYKEADFNIDLSPEEKKIMTFQIQIPQTQKKDIVGCSLVKIKGDVQNRETGRMFNIEVAKTNTIEIKINGDTENNTILQNSKYFIQKNQIQILKILILIVSLLLVINIIKQIQKKTHHKK